MDSAFTIADILILALILISALLALARGFTKEILAIVAWIIAALAVLSLLPPARPIVRGAISPDWLADVLAGGIIFIGVLVLVSTITYRWSERVSSSRVGTLDRTLGFLFGVARGLLIVAIAYIFFAWVAPLKEHPDWLRNARLLPLVEGTSEAVLALLPRDDTAPLDVRGSVTREPAPQSGAKPEPNGEADSKSSEEAGYTESETRAMDQLFGITADE